MQESRMSARGLVKGFGPVRAVKQVDLDIRIGEVLGLVGENGAGKSTLLSMLSGTLRPDEGSIELGGKRVDFGSYHQAADAGVFRVYQHQALVPNLTVAENVFMAQEAHFTRFGVLSSARMIAATQDVFDEFGLMIRPGSILGGLSFAERQVVEIVRCLAQATLLGIEHPVILLDEPTAALTRDQIDFFFSFVNKVKPRAAQVFVSHRLEEIIALCDRLVVLKDGEVVATSSEPRGLSEDRIHSLMVGREITMHRRKRQFADTRRPALEVSHLTGESFTDVSLRVDRGEVVGIAGVIGSGKSDLGKAIFELGRGCSGEIRIDGVQSKRQGARAGIRASVGYVPGERHLEGVVMSMTVAENHSLPFVGAALGGSVLNRRQELDDTHRTIAALKVKTPGPNTLIRNLSGGNQQKVILGRWLALGSDLLVLDNPTNGVDVGAKSEIYALVDEITASGVAVLLISDDLPEIISMSDRVLVMKDGRIRAEHDLVSDSGITEVDLVSEMV